jgi:hypothetical protein
VKAAAKNTMTNTGRKPGLSLLVATLKSFIEKQMMNIVLTEQKLHGYQDKPMFAVAICPAFASIYARSLRSATAKMNGSDWTWRNNIRGGNSLS